MKTIAIYIAYFGCFAVSAGCAAPVEPSSGAAEAPLGTSSQLLATEKAIPTDVGAPEYRHRSSVSKIHLGTDNSSRAELGLNKVVGSEGVFSTDPVSGRAMALINADSPAAKVPPLTTDPEVHNQRVRKYFEEAGLPADQIASVHVTTTMTGGAKATEALEQGQMKFEGYTSILDRTAWGFHVVESHAIARFNQNDEVTFESVYWPAIPATVVSAAKELDNMVHDPVSGPAFLARLPEAALAATAPRGVVIHHSTSAFHGVASFASYDVVVPPANGTKGRRHTRHFAADGRELFLPEPQATGPRPPPRQPRVPAVK